MNDGLLIVLVVSMAFNVSKLFLHLQGWMMGETLLNPGDSRVCD